MGAINFAFLHYGSCDHSTPSLTCDAIMGANGGEGHISLEPMQEAINSVEATLTEAEVQHIQTCGACHKLFGELLDLS